MNGGVERGHAGYRERAICGGRASCGSSIEVYGFADALACKAAFVEKAHEKGWEYVPSPKDTSRCLWVCPACIPKTKEPLTMDTREQQHEAELSKLNLDAPRVTPAMVDAAIMTSAFSVLQDGRSTICLLTLDNGFTVRGESACVSIENFDRGFGEKAAYEDARRKVWSFLAFRLADQLHSTRKPSIKLTPDATAQTAAFAGELANALSDCELPAPAEPRLPIDCAPTGPAIAAATFDSSGAYSKV